MDEAHDTPRICEACGGEDLDLESGCPWCTSGFQNMAQQVRWRKFRQRMSHISGTYSLFQSTVEEVISRLDRLTNDEARTLAIEGREVLTIWMISDHGSSKREEAANSLRLFYTRAMDYLTKPQL